MVIFLPTNINRCCLELNNDLKELSYCLPLQADLGFNLNQTVDLVSLAYRSIGDTSALQSKLQDGYQSLGWTTQHMTLDRKCIKASVLSRLAVCREHRLACMDFR